MLIFIDRNNEHTYLTKTSYYILHLVIITSLLPKNPNDCISWMKVINTFHMLPTLMIKWYLYQHLVCSVIQLFALWSYILNNILHRVQEDINVRFDRNHMSRAYLVIYMFAPVEGLTLLTLLLHMKYYWNILANGICLYGMCVLKLNEYNSCLPVIKTKFADSNHIFLVDLVRQKTMHTQLTTLNYYLRPWKKVLLLWSLGRRLLSQWILILNFIYRYTTSKLQTTLQEKVPR